MAYQTDCWVSLAGGQQLLLQEELKGRSGRTGRGSVTCADRADGRPVGGWQE